MGGAGNARDMSDSRWATDGVGGRREAEVRLDGQERWSDDMTMMLACQE